MELGHSIKRYVLLSLVAVVCFPTLARTQNTDVPTVLTHTVRVESIRPSFEHPGVIEAVRTASVRPTIRARIETVNITAGDIVEEGQLLLELEQTDYLIALAEAEANFKQAEANALKADLDLDRATRLFESDNVSQREVEYAQAQSDVAHAKMDIAAAQIDRAKEDLADTSVFAPFSGRISAPSYAVGDLYSPGDPTRPASIAEIVTLDPIYATGLVDQSNYFQFLARRLRIEEAGGSIPPLLLNITLPGGLKYPLQGRFENWDNTATASTGTIAARILFENPDGVLLPGQNVTITGQLIEAVEAVLVPQRAVSFDQQGHYVWVVSEGIAERRNVTVGIRDGADWTIILGLAEGDEVVVEGLQKMRSGLEVSPQPYSN